MNNSPEQKMGGLKRYAVVGDPVSHSLSPLIHNGWMESAGLDTHYTRVHLKSQTAAEDLRAMAGEFHGLNVTLPHKIAALAAGANSSPEARTIGAANTLVRDGDVWTAHNTDAAGFESATKAALGTGVNGRRVLLIGAGGAARAAVLSLQRSGAQLTIANRTVENARKLADDLAPDAVVTGLDDLERLSAAADIIVSSASFGHSGGVLPPLAPGEGRPFLDLSYGKAAQAVLRTAGQAGWDPHDGLTMLVAQAAASFELWFGIRPDEEQALAACRAAVAAT